jgi:hypothetical protein
LADTYRAKARDTIGRPRFDELAREGKRLSTDEAIELARTVARRIGGESPS